jgi:hypothetical protein
LARFSIVPPSWKSPFVETGALGPDHLEEDDVLRLPKARTAQDLGGGGDFFGGESRARRSVENGDAEGGLGPAFTKGPAAERVERVLQFHENAGKEI